MMTKPTDYNLSECLGHLATLLLRGELGDHWNEDPGCVIKCVATIVGEFAEIIKDSVDPAIIAAKNASYSTGDKMALVECCRAAGVIPKGSADPAGDMIDWFKLLWPILKDLIDKWLNNRSLEPGK